MLAVLGLAGPVWLFVPVLIVYIFRYTSIEVMFVAVCIDAYFGYGSSMPYLYTLCTAVLLLFVHTLRPYLTVYNQ